MSEIRTNAREHRISMIQRHPSPVNPQAALRVTPTTEQPLTQRELDDVVSLHRLALGYTLNARLGRRHLRTIYEITMGDSDSLVAVARDGSEIGGVVSATLDPEALSARLAWRLTLPHAASLLGHLARRPWMALDFLEHRQLARPLRFAGRVVRPCLTAIAVAPRHRGRSLGNLLVHAVDVFMRAHGEAAYRLDTRLQNKGAREFYRRLLFSEAEVMGRNIMLVRELSRDASTL